MHLGLSWGTSIVFSEQTSGSTGLAQATVAKSEIFPNVWLRQGSQICAQQDLASLGPTGPFAPSWTGLWGMIVFTPARQLRRHSFYLPAISRIIRHALLRLLTEPLAATSPSSSLTCGPSMKASTELYLRHGSNRTRGLTSLGFAGS